MPPGASKRMCATGSRPVDDGKIRIVEVGPRDGFQNVKAFIPTSVKYEAISAMFAAGVKEM